MAEHLLAAEALDGAQERLADRAVVVRRVSRWASMSMPQMVHAAFPAGAVPTPLTLQ
jgi:hypothetical protein